MLSLISVRTHFLLVMAIGYLFSILVPPLSTHQLKLFLLQIFYTFHNLNEISNLSNVSVKITMCSFILHFCVKDSVTRTIHLTGPSKDGLYPLHLPKNYPVSNVAFSTIRASPTTWHQRLGHPHLQLLQTLISKNCLPTSYNSVLPFCHSCPMGKSSKLHLSSSNHKSTHVLDLVFCDVCGYSPLNKNLMYIAPLHIFTQWLKDNSKHNLNQFKQIGEGNFETYPLFVKLGILHRLSCPHTSEQNGFVERRHRHVVETGLTLLAQSGVPTRFWNFAFETATYLINRMPSRNSSQISPFEHLFKRKPDLSFLRVFGCQCFPHLRPYHPHKMDFRSSPCIFLGYSSSHHGYQCLTLPQIAFTLPDMYGLMNHIFLFFNHPPLHLPQP